MCIRDSSKYVQDALNALGPEPAEGENEDPAIAEMRSKYTAVMNNYKNRLIEANLLKTEMARLNSIISEARSRIIIGNLVAEQNVLIAPHNFFTAIGDAAVFFWEIAISPVEWYRGLSACAKIRWIQTQVCTYVHGLRFLFCKGTANGGKNERRSKAHPAGPAPRTHP